MTIQTPRRTSIHGSTMNTNRTADASGSAKERYTPEQWAEKKARHNRKVYGRRRHTLPNYGRYSKPEHEVFVKPGSDDELDDGKDNDNDHQDNDNDHQDTPIKAATATTTKAKDGGTRTLAELQKHHDELAVYIKKTKESIGLRRESLAKEAARKAVERARKAKEVAGSKDVEFDMGVGIN
jgi:hypothetical protein